MQNIFVYKHVYYHKGNKNTIYKYINLNINNKRATISPIIHPWYRNNFPRVHSGIARFCRIGHGFLLCYWTQKEKYAVKWYNFIICNYKET